MVTSIVINKMQMTSEKSFSLCRLARNYEYALLAKGVWIDTNFLEDALVTCIVGLKIVHTF